MNDEMHHLNYSDYELLDSALFGESGLDGSFFRAAFLNKSLESYLKVIRTVRKVVLVVFAVEITVVEQSSAHRNAVR